MDKFGNFIHYETIMNHKNVILALLSLPYKSCDVLLWEELRVLDIKHFIAMQSHRVGNFMT